MKTMDATLLVVQWQSATGLLYWRQDEPNDEPLGLSSGWVVSPQQASCFHDEPKARAKAELIADELSKAHQGPIDVIEAAVAIDFTCRVCGVECDIATNPPQRAVCPEHCPDHNYEYDRWERQHLCIICNKSRPDDWND